MYDDQYESDAEKGGGDLPLHNYATALSRLAASDPQISFVNLENHVGGYDELVANGWMLDATHPTREGALQMSQIVVDALYAGAVPEPASVGCVLVGGVVLLARRRRL